MLTALPDVAISVVLAGTSKRRKKCEKKLQCASCFPWSTFKKCLGHYDAPTLEVLIGKCLFEVAGRLRFLVSLIVAHEDAIVSDGKGASEKIMRNIVFIFAHKVPPQVQTAQLMG